MKRKSRHYRVIPEGPPLPEQAPGRERSPELRLADLVAKTARVTQKDAMRVLVALGAVSAFYGKDMDSVVNDIEFNPTRPDCRQAQACDDAFRALTASNVDDQEVLGWLSLMRELQTER